VKVKVKTDKAQDTAASRSLLPPLSFSSIVPPPPHSRLVLQIEKKKGGTRPPISGHHVSCLKIKTRASSSQSKHSAICAMPPSSAPRPYILRVSAVRTFLTVSRHILTPLTPSFSLSAHSRALCGFFIQFPNPDHPDPRIRGPCDGL
jgi:hypothetical protein